MAANYDHVNRKSASSLYVRHCQRVRAYRKKFLPQILLGTKNMVKITNMGL